MKKIILTLAILSLYSLNAFSYFKAGVETSVSNQEIKGISNFGNEISKIENQLNEPSLFLGYERKSFDIVLVLKNTEFSSDLLLKSNYLKIYKDILFNVGINIAHPHTVPNYMSNDFKKAGFGFQIGLSKEFFQNFSYYVEYMSSNTKIKGCMNDCSTGEDIALDLRNNSLNFGLVFKIKNFIF